MLIESDKPRVTRFGLRWPKRKPDQSQTFIWLNEAPKFRSRESENEENDILVEKREKNWIKNTQILIKTSGHRLLLLEFVVHTQILCLVC